MGYPQSEESEESEEVQKLRELVLGATAQIDSWLITDVREMPPEYVNQALGVLSEIGRGRTPESVVWV